MVRYPFGISLIFRRVARLAKCVSAITRAGRAGKDVPKMQAPNACARILQVMDGELSRRQYVRVAVTLPVQFSVEGEAKPHDGSVFDLGAGGMRLVASYDLPARANVGLKFHVPGTERTVQARGLVVLSFFARNEQKFHHGIAFTSIEPRDRTAIAGFVESSDAQRRA